MQTLHKAAQAVARKDPLDISNMGQFRDACLSAARMFGWDGNAQPSVNYYGDVNTVVVCDEARRKELIAQRQRLLEQEAEAEPVIGHKVAAAVPVALPAPAPQPEANVGAGNATVAGNQRPTAKQDPLCQWRDSVGRAESWKTNEPENQPGRGMFGPYPEEQEKW